MSYKILMMRSKRGEIASMIPKKYIALAKMSKMPTMVKYLISFK